MDYYYNMIYYSIFYRYLSYSLGVDPKAVVLMSQYLGYFNPDTERSIYIIEGVRTSSPVVVIGERNK